MGEEQPEPDDFELAVICKLVRSVAAALAAGATRPIEKIPEVTKTNSQVSGTPSLEFKADNLLSINLNCLAD